MIISIEFNHHSIHIHNLKNGNKFGIRFGNLFRSISFSFCFSFSKYIIYTQWSTIHQWEKKGRERNEKHDDHHHRPNDISSYWQWKHQTDRHYSLMSRCVVVSIKLMMQTNQKKEKNTDTVAAVGLNRSNHHELWSFFTRLTIFLLCFSVENNKRRKNIHSVKRKAIWIIIFFVVVVFNQKHTHTKKTSVLYLSKSFKNFRFRQPNFYFIIFQANLMIIIIIIVQHLWSTTTTFVRLRYGRW